MYDQTKSENTNNLLMMPMEEVEMETENIRQKRSTTDEHSTINKVSTYR